MKTINVEEIKNHGLTWISEIIEKHETITIKKNKKTIAHIVPVNASTRPKPNALKNSIVFEKDIIAPIDLAWDAML